VSSVSWLHQLIHITRQHAVLPSGAERPGALGGESIVVSGSPTVSTLFSGSSSAVCPHRSSLSRDGCARGGRSPGRQRKAVETTGAKGGFARTQMKHYLLLPVEIMDHSTSLQLNPSVRNVRSLSPRKESQATFEGRSWGICVWRTMAASAALRAPAASSPARLVSCIARFLSAQQPCSCIRALSRKACIAETTAVPAPLRATFSLSPSGADNDERHCVHVPAH
jgi:hypothetical protein